MQIIPRGHDGLNATYAERISAYPFSIIATAIFALAILHTFSAARFVALAHRAQLARDEQRARSGQPLRPSTLDGTGRAAAT